MYWHISLGEVLQAMAVLGAAMGAVLRVERRMTRIEDALRLVPCLSGRTGCKYSDQGHLPLGS